MNSAAKLLVSAFYISLFLQNILLSVNPIIIATALQASSVGGPLLGGIALGVGSGIIEDRFGFQGKRESSLTNQYMHRVYHASLIAAIGLFSWKAARMTGLPSDIAFSSALMAIHSFAFGRYMWDEGDHPVNEPAQEMYYKLKHIPSLVAGFLIASRVPELREHMVTLNTLSSIGAAFTLCSLS